MKCWEKFTSWVFGIAKCCLRKFTTWLSTENVRKVADLYFRLVGILAAFAAMEFFTLRPDVVLGSPTSAHKLKIDQLEQKYKDERKEGLLDAVKEMAEAYNSDATTWAEPWLYSAFVSPFAGPWGRSELSEFFKEGLPPPEDWLQPYVPDPEALDVIVENFGEWPSDPLALYVAVMASNTRMARDDLQFAIDAAKSARYLLVLVPVSNMGNGVARGLVVKVTKAQVQEDFSVDESPKFDLAPGPPKTLTFEAKLGKHLDVSNDELETWFAIPVPSLTERLDVQTIKCWAFRLLVIPISLLLWDIFGPRTEQRTGANASKR